MFTWCVMSGLISPGFFPLLTIMFLCWSQFNNSNVFPTWQTTYKQNGEFINSASCYYLLKMLWSHISFTHEGSGLHYNITRTQVWTFTFTVSNEALSRMTTSLLSDMRLWRLRRCLAGLGSYSSKCSKPRFFPSGAAMMLSACRTLFAS